MTAASYLGSVARTVRGIAFGPANAPDWIGKRYGGTDKFDHGYLKHYRCHFGSLRFRRNLVFEIGVGGHGDIHPGGSLPMWRDYLLRSTIIGLDIHPKAVEFGSRVEFVQVDQNNPDALESVVAKYGRPNIVIDDGSHVGEHIHTSFETLWPHVAARGLYVVEDLAASYFPHSGGGDPAPPTSGVGLIQSLIGDVEARDPTFTLWPEWGSRSAPVHDDVAAVLCYPGIAFVQKA